MYAFIGVPWWISCKESACNARDMGSIPRSGRPPGEGNGNPLQSPCLEKPMDRGAWHYSPWGQSQTRVSDRAELNRHVTIILRNEKRALCNMESGLAATLPLEGIHILTSVDAWSFVYREGGGHGAGVGGGVDLCPGDPGELV